MLQISHLVVCGGEEPEVKDMKVKKERGVNFEGIEKKDNYKRGH